MNLLYMPLYCGGKLLTGFYSNTVLTDSEIIKKSLEFQTKYDGTMDNHFGPFQHAPRSLENFQLLLKQLIKPHISGHIGIGVIYAITNGIQIKSAENLSNTGFKKIGSYSKYANQTGKCDTWLGDYFKDVKPILDKIKEETKNDTKKPAFTR